MLEICYLYAPSTYPAVTERVPSPKATKLLPPPELAHSSHHLPTNKSERSQQAPKPPGPTSPLPGKHQSPVNWRHPLLSVFVFPADRSKTRSFRRGSALTHRLPHHTHICPFITARTSCPSPHWANYIRPSFHPTFPWIIPRLKYFSSNPLSDFTKKETAVNFFCKHERHWIGSS